MKPKETRQETKKPAEAILSTIFPPLYDYRVCGQFKIPARPGSDDAGLSYND